MAPHFVHVAPRHQLQEEAPPDHTHSKKKKAREMQLASGTRLPQRAAPTSIGDLLDTTEDRARPCQVLQEILARSWPIALTTICESLPLILITALIGHAPPATALPPPLVGVGAPSTPLSGASVLEAYGLGSLVYSTCAFAIVFGIMSGLDSVAAAAVGGSESAPKVDVEKARLTKAQFSYQSLSEEGEIVAPASPGGPTPSPMLGSWVLRCLYLEMVVVTLLMAALYTFAESGLRAIGEPEESIPNAVAFVNIMLIGLPFVAVYYTLNRGLQAAGVVLPILAIVLAVKSTAVLFVYLELFAWQMSILAVAWTLSIAAFIQTLCVFLYMRSAGLLAAWFGTDEYAEPTYTPWSQLFRGFGAYAWLAIPAAIAVCLEFWLFDLVGMLAGLLPNAAVELSTHYLLFSCCFTCYTIFSGLSVGVSVVVGHHMGVPGESTLAYRSAVVGLAACAAISASFMLILVFFHRPLAEALTSDEAILRRFSDCVPVLVVYTAVDGLNTCATQLLRTLGVQNYGVFLHFATYYLCGVTAGYLLATAEATALGVMGLWIGLCIGVGLNASIATIWLWQADWRHQCEAAIQRAVEDRLAHSASAEALMLR